MIPINPLAWLIVGFVVNAYAILGYVVGVFRPAIDRAVKPRDEEL